MDPVRRRTSSGGFFALVAFLVASVLSPRLFSSLETITKDHYQVDTSFGDHYKFKLNITFPSLHCSEVDVNCLDLTGSPHLHLSDGFKKLVVKNGATLGEWYPPVCETCYEAANHTCCNSCLELREAYFNEGFSRNMARDKPQCKDLGCRLEGSATVMKVAGDIRITAGTMFYEGGRVMHDLNIDDLQEYGFNISHTVHALSLGHEGHSDVSMPLQGVQEVHSDALRSYIYDLEFVPTEFYANDQLKRTHQYTVQRSNIDISISNGQPNGVPGFFLLYKFSPLMLHLESKKTSPFVLFASSASLVGGVFALFSLFDKLSCIRQKINVE